MNSAGLVKMLRFFDEDFRKEREPDSLAMRIWESNDLVQPLRPSHSLANIRTTLGYSIRRYWSYLWLRGSEPFNLDLAKLQIWTVQSEPYNWTSVWTIQPNPCVNLGIEASVLIGVCGPITIDIVENEPDKRCSTSAFFVYISPCVFTFHSVY